jgi:hypothetical protein
MQFDETIQEVLKRVVDDIRRKNPEVSNDYAQYGFFTLTSNELLDEIKTVRSSMDVSLAKPNKIRSDPFCLVAENGSGVETKI